MQNLERWYWWTYQKGSNGDTDIKNGLMDTGGGRRGWEELRVTLKHALPCVNFSVQFSGSVMSDSLQPHGLHHARLPCPWPTPRSYSNSCPSSPWCHPTVSSCCPLLLLPSIFRAAKSFPMSQFFASGGQSIGASASASVFPVNIQDWFPLGWTGLISLQSKGLSSIFSNTTVQRHQFFGAQTSCWLNSHIPTRLLENP